jgi:uncharacterized protein (DUF433 family)
MNLPDFLTRLPEGEILITGHRIGLYHIVERYNEGESAEMLASRYPTLPLSLVHRLIAFYLDNKSEIDSYVAHCSAELDTQRKAGKHVDLSALRERLASQGGCRTATGPSSI